MKLWHCIWGMVIVLAFLRPSEVNACFCPTPGIGFSTSDGVAPANAQGVVFFCRYCTYIDKRGNRQLPEISQFRVEQVVDSGQVRIGFSLDAISKKLLLVRPNKRMKAGSRYRFSYNRCIPFYRTRDGKLLKRLCKPDWISVEITMGKESLLPRKSPAGLIVGQIEKGQLKIKASGSCSANVEAGKRSIKLALTPLESKFKNSLMFETTVDGMPWIPLADQCDEIVPGRSWKGIGTDLLFLICSDAERASFRSWEKIVKEPGSSISGLTKGTHKVRMTATLPGVGVIADSGEVEVEIGCD
jgi:hypothetical protein